MFAVAAVAALAAGVALSHRGRVNAPVVANAAPASTAIPPTAGPLDASLLSDAQRAVFPYSVVPGGVDSVDELRKAIAADPVVAEHYKGFDLSKARVERLETPRVAHVSYRIGRNVYWTSKPVVLPAGERVITDGVCIARTRCGNQVAARPGVTSPAEPAASVLDTPAASALDTPVASRPFSASSAAALSTLGRKSGIAPALAGGGAGGSGGGAPGSPGSSGIAGGTPGAAAPSAASSSSSDSNATPSKVDFNPCSVGSTACSPGGSGAASDPGVPGNPPGGFPPPSFGSNPPSGPPGGPGDHPFGPPNPPGGPGDPGDPKNPGNPTGHADPPFDPPGGGPNPPGDGPNPPANGPTPPGDGPTPPRQEAATIPEPASMLLMLTGAGGLLARRLSARRRG